jgi:hypothetical protein
MPKGMFENKFQKYFDKVYSLNLKGLLSNYFLLCKLVINPCIRTR